MLSFQDKIKPISTTNSTSGLSFADKIKPIIGIEQPIKEETEPGIIERLQTSVKESGTARGEAVKDIRQAFRSGEQGPVRSTLQIAGQLIAAGVGDPLINIAKTVVPKTTEKIGKKLEEGGGIINMADKLAREKGYTGEKGLLKPAIEAISDIPVVQKFAESPASRVLERDIEAINNWLMVLAPGKATTALKAGISTIGKAEQSAISGIQSRAVNKLESDYLKWTGSTKPGIKKIFKAEKRTEALNKAGTEGVTPARVLAEEGIIPETEGTHFRTARQADNFKASNEPLYEANQQALKEIEMQTERVKLSDLEKRAIENARTTRNIAGGKFDDLASNIKSEFENYRKNYGDSVPLTTVDDIKSARWADTKFDMTKPLKSDINYNIAKAAQKTIEETASKAGFDDVAQFNRYLGDRLEAVKFLQGLDGQVIKGGRLGKYVGMTIGSVGGTVVTGGVTGTILGTIIGNTAANILIKTSVANPIKRLVLRTIRKTKPEVYQNMRKFLEDQANARSVRKALPPASFTPLGPKQPPVSSVRSFSATKGEPGRNPKTGKFFRTYSSEPVSRYTETAKTAEIGAVGTKTATKSAGAEIASQGAKQGQKSSTSVLRYTEKIEKSPVTRETPVKKTNLEVKNKIGKEEFNLTTEEAKKELGKLFDEKEIGFLFKDDLGKGVGGLYRPGKTTMYGSIAKPIIELLEKNGKVSNLTLYHESFHAYLNNFVSEIERSAILKKVQENYLSKISQQFYRKNYKGAIARAEEWLADDFAKYVKNGTGQFSSLYQKIIEKVRGWIRKSTGAQKIYDDILAKKRPEGMVINKNGEVKYKMGEVPTEQKLSKLGLKSDDVISVKRFGSSVEGKKNPNDFDHFIIVKDGSMKFPKKGGLPAPIIKKIGKDQFFIMPESEGENLLDAMLYTGRKDSERLYSGKTIDVTKDFKGRN